MLGFQVQFVRISDIVFAVLFVFDYIVFNVTFAHGGAGWWLWALGMAQIGGDEKTGVRALSLLVRCPKACGIALLKPNEQRRPHADMVYIDNVLPHRYSRTRAYIIPVSVYCRTSLV